MRTEPRWIAWVSVGRRISGECCSRPSSSPRASRRSRQRLRELEALNGTADSRRELEQEEESIDLAFLATQAPRAVARIGEGAARMARIVEAMNSLARPGSEQRLPLDVNR